jgi:hypothetical protein
MPTSFARELQIIVGSRTGTDTETVPVLCLPGSIIWSRPNAGDSIKTAYRSSSDCAEVTTRRRRCADPPLAGKA